MNNTTTTITRKYKCLCDNKEYTCGFCDAIFNHTTLNQKCPLHGQVRIGRRIQCPACGF